MSKIKKVFLGVLLLAVVLFIRHIYNSENSFYVPDRQFVSVDQYIASPDIDYDAVFSVTGLSPYAAKELLDSGKSDVVKSLNQMYFNKPDISKNYILYPFTAEERNVEQITPIAPLKDGDILVTFATQTCDWRHGHCAIVVDAEKGIMLEHMAIGQTSCLSSTVKWGTYPNFAVLRYTDSEVASAAANYASKHLIGIDYSIFAGILKKDMSGDDRVDSSHCSHIVWQAYKACGVDIDCDRSILVTPRDVAMSGKLKVVQIYGLNPDDFQSRLLE